MLFNHIAKIAALKDCGRFEWSVLNWNRSAIEFYESFGAKPQNEWIVYRLDRKVLRDFANN